MGINAAKSFADRIADKVLDNIPMEWSGAEIIHVDGTNGSDANVGGPTWEKAYATIDAAIDYARYELGTTTISYTDKRRHKVVLIAPGHYNEGEILWSGYNIHVVGCGPAVPGKDYGVSINYDGAADATAAFLISGSGNSLENVHIYCDFAAPAIYLYNGDNNLVRNVVVEADGTNCTYGIKADSMKGSRIEGCVIQNTATAGIYLDGGADRYFIEGWIRDNHIHSNVANTTGILVDVDMLSYNGWIDHNFVSLTNGASCKGIDVNTTSLGPVVCDNYVSVPSSATAIEHAAGDQFLLGNHTAAGTTNTDPNPAAG